MPPERAVDGGPLNVAVNETTTVPGVVARADELARLHDFLAGSGEGTRTMVVHGPPGIGKSTLWEAAVVLARQRGLRTLTARASDAETTLFFATLVDLLHDLDLGLLTGLPSPQRHALEVALLRAEPRDLPPGEHAIALGLLTALRALAADDPLLVAIDDVQWLDEASAHALSFALRRLAAEPIWVVLARRDGSVAGLEQAVPGERLTTLPVGPQSVGAIRELLAQRLGLRLSRHDLRRVHDITLGNPLFALAVGRRIVARPESLAEDQLPFPDDIESALGTAVDELPDAVRRLLLALALDANLRTHDVAALGAAGTLAEAVAAGVVTVAGDRIRARHPLLAAAARSAASELELRGVHLDLAAAVGDEQQRALHLALGSTGTDDEKAALVASAALRTSARGAPRQAALLARHALRLTSVDAAAWPDRVLDLAEHLRVSGDKAELTDLLLRHVDDLSTPAQRVRALLLLTSGHIEHSDDIRRQLERAIAEAGDDPALRSPVLGRMVDHAAVVLEDLPTAHTWALEAVAASADRPDHRLLAEYGLAWTRALRGQRVELVPDPAIHTLAGSHVLPWAPERVAGQQLVWRGEVDRARALLTALLRQADGLGAPYPYALLRLHVCELELRVGSWAAAEALLDEWADSPDNELLHWPMYERCRALVAAGKGEADEAVRWGEQAVARADETGGRWDRFEAQRALGAAALLRHEPAVAVEALLPVWEHAERHGIDDPGVFPVAGDLVEALVETDDVATADRVTDRLRRLATEQDHPWALATSERSWGTTRLASSYGEDAVTSLTAAAQQLADLGLRYDSARAVLALGRAQRRHRKWAAARETLSQAVATFDSLDASGWAQDARAELSRVGARRPAPAGSLTPTELRVAQLAAEGRSNKEIASMLVVTVNTVEFHLRNVFAKLGIRSRNRLATRLPEQRRTGRPRRRPGGPHHG